MIAFSSQRTIQVIHCAFPTLPAAIDLGQRYKCRRTPGRVPCGFIKRLVGFVLAAQITQREAEVVERFAVVWIRVAAGQAGNGGAKMLLGQFELATTQMPASQCSVASTVQWIA